MLGGGIIPTQEPALTTTRSRNNPFGLIVALSQQGHAYGDLYLVPPVTHTDTHNVAHIPNASFVEETNLSMATMQG